MKATSGLGLRKLGKLSAPKLAADKEKVVVFPSLTLEAFPECCGAMVLGRLDTDTILRSEYRPDDATTLDDFFYPESDGYFENSTHGPTPGQLVLATTVPSQTTAISELKRLGFVEMASWKNPNSSNTPTIWARIY